jgi:hypothetical protein
MMFAWSAISISGSVAVLVFDSMVELSAVGGASALISSEVGWVLPSNV